MLEFSAAAAVAEVVAFGPFRYKMFGVMTDIFHHGRKGGVLAILPGDKLHIRDGMGEKLFIAAA